MIDKREITPEFLARVSGILFSKVRFEDVLNDVDSSYSPNKTGRMYFDSLTHEEIADLLMEDTYFRQSYSRMECISYARGLVDYVFRTTHWRNRNTSLFPDRLNVFDLLLIVLDDLLFVNHREVECSYAHILSWRTLYQAIGEELPVSAKHALWDYNRGRPDCSNTIFEKQLDWHYVTPHNNKPLDRIMQRGIADHHSHLWGSTPYFHVSWINIMNHLTNSKYIRNLRTLPLKERSESSGKISYGENLQMRAAWIRWYLCSRLFSNNDSALESNSVDIYTEQKIICNCNDWHQLILLRSALQSRINACAVAPSIQPDYVLNLFPWRVSPDREDYKILVGERGFYYHVFSDYCHPPEERKLSRSDYALFYAYCLIRVQIREQMVQVNNRIGFDNFQAIEKRKWYFLGDDDSLRYLSRLAVNQVLHHEYIKELEIRISPNPNDLIKLEEL